MADHAERCFRDLTGAFATARFMTITFDCTDWMMAHSPGDCRALGNMLSGAGELPVDDVATGYGAGMMKEYHARPDRENRQAAHRESLDRSTAVTGPLEDHVDAASQRLGQPHEGIELRFARDRGPEFRHAPDCRLSPS